MVKRRARAKEKEEKKKEKETEEEKDSFLDTIFRTNVRCMRELDLRGPHHVPTDAEYFYLNKSQQVCIAILSIWQIKNFTISLSFLR